MDTVAPMAYVDAQCMLDEGNGEGFPHYWKSNFLKTLGDEAIDMLVEAFLASPSPLDGIVIEVMGPAVRRVAPDATAFEHRASPFNLLFGAMWTAPAQQEPSIRWARENYELLRASFLGGAYVNYLGQAGDEDADRVKASYGAAHYERLVTLKNKHDPANLFRLNQNIKPSVSHAVLERK
jgi:hypothetical protein